MMFRNLNGPRMDDQLIDGMNARERRYAKYGIWESDSDTDEETDFPSDEDRREPTHAQNAPDAPETQTKRM
jgi:hypothetical protein